ncbi:MAG: hypothetical protein FJ265_19360 [Planctomycetes bacterium]|nr:hypothetical protein [Planctomycetota bacterium]
MNPPRARRPFLFALLLLAACQSATDLLYEPKPQDRLDGYEGSLAEAGINTEMDWGPKQNLLLSQYKTLKEEQARLQKRLDEALAENQNLKTQLNGANEVAQREKTQRVQSEAQLELRQQKQRELEATVLSLRIEKAKLEQQNLLSRIDALEQSLAQSNPQSNPQSNQQSAPKSAEPAAAPPGRQ